MSEHEDHGHTVAAWTAVAIITVAFLVGTIGVIIAKPAIFWVGVSLIFFGLIAGKVLALLGFGAKH
ncbi:MAG: hypothetical protein KGQ38_05265 [Actinomycetales bacterium]|nr:hypothetical protein [Actinomycetales bacterium]